MAGKSAEFCEYTVLKGNSSLPSPERRFRTCRAHRPSKRQPAESKQYTPAKGPWSEPRCRPFPVAPQTVVTPLRRHSRTGSSWGQWRSLRHQRMQAPTSIPIRIPVSVCSDTVEGPGAQGGTQTGPSAPSLTTQGGGGRRPAGGRRARGGQDASRQEAGERGAQGSPGPRGDREGGPARPTGGYCPKRRRQARAFSLWRVMESRC